MGGWIVNRSQATERPPPARPRIRGGDVILHADDFGMNRAVTRGILHGFSHGLLTSTSLLANAPDAAAALVGWKQLLADQRDGRLPSQDTRRRLSDAASPFDLGIHINLTQGRPLTGERYPAELLDAQGRFPGIFPVFRKLWRVVRKLEPAIEAELCAQIERLLDHGLAPTHLNGHQYIETLPGIAAVVPRVMHRYGIPVVRVARESSLLRTTLFRGEPANAGLASIKCLFATRFQRQMDAAAIARPQAFFGTSHAGRINLNLMQAFLRSGQRGDGPIEIGMHPGCLPERAVDFLCADGWGDPLAVDRPHELSLLTSPQFAELLAQHHLALGRLRNLATPFALKSAA